MRWENDPAQIDTLTHTHTELEYICRQAGRGKREDGGRNAETFISNVR